MEQLNSFLLHHSVPTSLATRIRSHITERAKEKKALTLDDLPSLSELPVAVMQELRCSMFARTLLNHSVFYTWCLTDDLLLSQIVLKAISLKACNRHDDVFVPSQNATHALALHAGRLRYQRELFTASFNQEDFNEDFDDAEVILEPGDWASMVAIWCEWKYVGRLHALEMCELFSLAVEALLDVLKDNPLILTLSKGYARAYSLLVAAGSEFASQADLNVPHASVLLAMSINERSDMSHIMIQSFTDGPSEHNVDEYFPVWRHKLGDAASQQLKEEVNQGKCIVSLGSDWQLLRTVVICVVHIADSASDKILYEIAKADQDMTLKPQVRLPATKLKEGECTMAAAKRQIKDLPPLNGTLQYDSCKTEKTQMKSKFEIRSVYIKTTWCVTLGTEIRAPTPQSPKESSRSLINAKLKTPATAIGMPVTRKLSVRRQSSTCSYYDPDIFFNHLEGLHVTGSDGRKAVYSWLSLDEVEYLLSPAANGGFEQWLSENGSIVMI